MDRDTYENYEAQANMQRQGIEGQNIPHTPQMFEQVQQAQAVLVEQTNPKKTVESIILKLRGLKRLPDGNEVKISEFSKPKMNNKGIESVSFTLDSHINQNIILSHLDEIQITKIMDSLGDDLVDNLRLNWRKFGIKDKSDLDDINNSILVNIYAALKRAEGQNEKNWLGKISIEQISGSHGMPKPKKEGFWSKFRL